MAKRINDTEIRKRQILQTASDLFLEKGYAGVGIDEIAAACGVVRGTVLRYFHSKKELYNEILFGRGNSAGNFLEQYSSDKNTPVLVELQQLLVVLEKQFTTNIQRYRKKLREEEFRQNFEVLRLPIFRNEAKMLEQILIRGNEEGVLHIENPKVRAYSFAFAMFGLTETPDLDERIIGDEIWQIAESMLQVKIPREKAEMDTE